MDRAERLLLIAITLLHLLAQIHLYHSLFVRTPMPLHSSQHESLAYQESFQYTTDLYPFLSPDTVWLKQAD